jgi:hypothetical protein
LVVITYNSNQKNMQEPTGIGDCMLMRGSPGDCEWLWLVKAVDNPIVVGVVDHLEQKMHTEIT